jgi:hypothetical protein
MTCAKRHDATQSTDACVVAVTSGELDMMTQILQVFLCNA